MWRNPLTNRFEAGNGPVDRRQSDGVGQPPTLPQDTSPIANSIGSQTTVTSGWDFVPTPDGVPDEGGSCESVADVLNAGNPHAALSGTDSLYGRKKEHEGGVK